ncbi:MAG: hypothetical protein FWF46_05745 [Oscillospiraceae bacterium]|nr:hypothetical protein [Oscillospiraceae bacterium]
MENDIKKANAEVDTILGFMEQKYVDKVPEKLRRVFKENQMEDYKPNINPNIPLAEQNLQIHTLALLAMLNLNYWCESEEHKQELLNLYAENDKKREAELREKYNPDNIFKKKEQEKSTEETALVEYKAEGFFRKILNMIAQLFKRQ